MAKWSTVAAAAPEVAELAQARIEATGLGFLATLRNNGFPRVSGVEPTFRGGELLLGMMTGSWKARDLLRDPRCCLHNASIDKEVREGDAKITGRAFEVDDPAPKEALRQDVIARTGQDPGTDYHLFRLDVTEVATIRPAGDHLLIDSWREGERPRQVKRF